MVATDPVGVDRCAMTGTGGRRSTVTMTEDPVSDADRAKIMGAARDYIEAWLDGDADRMARALHADLAKRSVERDGTGGCTVHHVTRDDMVRATGESHGIRYERPYDATILDAFGDIAAVRILSSVYMDYLHIARCGEEWRIINALWQRRPGR
jgi:hypothetical protein